MLEKIKKEEDSGAQHTNRQEWIHMPEVGEHHIAIVGDLDDPREYGLVSQPEEYRPGDQSQ